MSTPGRTPDRFPPEHAALHAKMRRLAWVTIAYLASAAVLLGVVMGDSQALKTEWVDDIISLIPPIAFIASSRVVHKKPSDEYPYGYHRAATLAFFAGSVALAGIGGFLFIDGIRKLVVGHRPTIGAMEVFGHVVWRGWVAFAILAYSALPAIVLGRIKKRLAKKMQDVGVIADADMNKADAVTAVAACAGLAGVGFGWWWADAAAAIAISMVIIWDGVKNLRRSVAELMDREPRTLKGKAEPICARLACEAKRVPWVARAAARLREDGGVLVGEIFVVPTRAAEVRELTELTRRLEHLDRRLNLLVVPVAELPVANAVA